MKPQYLLDEHITPRLKAALLRLDPTIAIVSIGDPETPALGAQDPDILRFVEQRQQILVAQDYRTLPDHASDHRDAGGQHWGIFLVRPGAGIGETAAALYEIWVCSEAEEWIDQVVWIPL
jgi:hypothetical protein